ncbi:MAG: gamma-glutamyltransferase family protein [Pseudomonadota bacterium]|nr:gamma-glutamyltransferase family protein [Pseudomonadota bacterium]
MLHTRRCLRGMVVAPHHLAASAGLGVLRDGGNAVEAMVTAASTIMMVYPHMNALGGDNFWLISEGGKPPVAIDACGPAAGLASIEFYREAGHGEAIPPRGPLAALTVAGAISGWAEALKLSARWGGRLPLSRLLADATAHARDGTPVSSSLGLNLGAKANELKAVPGFADVFLPKGSHPAEGDILRQPRAADTLERLARAGLDDFYRGDVARSLARDLKAAGSPLRLADLEAFRARVVDPLSVKLAAGTVYNMPPPTQGLASLMILGLFERLGVKSVDDFAYVHGLVEATKQAFLVRDAHITDPDFIKVDPGDFLKAAKLDELARRIDPRRALPWPQPAVPGDTVWLGAIDGEGRAVSFIQSIYWEFGSGLILPSTGALWQNRGASFRLEPGAMNALKPGRRPFHTIQPAMALLKDGRVMPYGTLGGEGQPQTQAVVFTRHVLHGQPLEQAIAAPRWLLGRTWGAETTNLRMENRFPDEVVGQLRAAGHDVEVIGAYDEVMGHAGALVRSSGGVIEGASDPRSDGAAAGF